MGVHTGKRKFMYVIVLLFVWDNHTKRNGFKITLVIAYDKCQLTMCRRVKEQRCEWKVIERWILDEREKKYKTMMFVGCFTTWDVFHLIYSRNDFITR